MAWIGTDDFAAGRLAADAMARFVRPGGRVAIVAGIPGDAGSAARTQGFIHGARGRFAVAQTVAADFDRSQANLAAAELLGASRVDGFFAVSDEMALGVVAAVRAAGKEGRVAVVGMDGIAEALTAVKRGWLAATVARYPFTMGRLGVEACLAALRGKAIPSSVEVPMQLVTGQNVHRAQRRFPHPMEPFEDPLLRLISS
jgi:ribose transport system substrate-binding protein